MKNACLIQIACLIQYNLKTKIVIITFNAPALNSVMSNLNFHVCHVHSHSAILTEIAALKLQGAYDNFETAINFTNPFIS
jgi:hypothetical protein